MKIKPICINLKTATERRQSAELLFDEIFGGYYMFDAINGSEINVCDTTIPHIKIVDYHNNYFMHDTTKRDLKMSYGEFGCAMSQIILYNHLANDIEYDAYFIFEDDVTKSPQYTKEAFDTFMREIDNVKFDICHMHNYNFAQFNQLTAVQRYFYKLNGYGFARNTAYIISKSGADKIIRHIKNYINFPADDIISNLFKNKQLDVVVPSVSLFTHADTPSTIWNIYKHDEDYKKVVWDKPYVKYESCDIYSSKRFTYINKKNRNFITALNLGSAGRLGNQMFQYAVLRDLSIKMNLDLKLLNYTTADRHKTCRLMEAFDVNIPILTKNDISTINYTYDEQQFHYDDKINMLPIGKNYNLNGYFQSYKYFSDNNDLIIKDFTFKKGIRDYCEPIRNKYREMFPNYKLVALHIRRDDILHSGAISVSPTDDYINNGLRYIREHDQQNIKIIVFSDDAAWCRNKFTGSDYIVSDLTSDIADLYMMTQCDHIILSPSSFSWWGAWLNPNKNKIVIVPDPWFNPNHDRVSKYITSDIVPSNWIKIQNLKIPDTTYDIVYSMTAHEAPDVLANTIDNIVKYNKDNKILICLHLNNYMYNNFRTKHTNVVINSSYWDKQLNNFDLIKAYMENYSFLKRNNYKFNNIMLLSSNCMFVKQIGYISAAQYDINKEVTIYDKPYDLNSLNYHLWPHFLVNKTLVDFLISNKIELVKATHEGALYNADLFGRICDFIIKNKIMEIAINNICIEEFLLPMLEKYFSGEVAERYCKNFMETTLSDVTGIINKETNVCIVKRVTRNMSDPLRVYINNLSS